MSAVLYTRWVRVNLFANAFDSVLSLIFIPLAAWACWSLAAWALTEARWHVVSDNLRVLMVGTFPSELSGRAWLSAGTLALLAGATIGCVASLRSITTLLALSAMACLASLAFGYQQLGVGLTLVSLCLAGWQAAQRWTTLRRLLGAAWIVGVGIVGVALAPAGSEHWGGLLMSVLVTLFASVSSIPLGVALAFGRRSRFASARVLCTGYIEVMRSLPLILIVYWVWVVTPLLVVQAPPDLFRGLLAFTLFFAAYVAEYVRSGLQSVPKGQVEAAQSLGMSPWQINRDIVLPQAVRVVSPALVGNVLDIFNTVPLLFIIGLTDFLRAGQMVLVNPQSAGRTYEMYVFMFVVYLAIASLITFGARRLEVRLSAGHR